MSNEKLLRVLTIFDSSEEAEVLINILRKAGYIIRDIRVEDDEDMETAIEDNPLDIILAKQTLPIFNAVQAIKLMVKSGRDIPFIVITPKSQEASAIEVLNLGARDAVASDQSERLKFVVKRELADLKNRRALRQNEKLLHETEKRTTSLIDSSRDAIAYVHDGAHIYANSAYLKMFGYADLEDIEGMPILDMVSNDHHKKLKEFLRGYAKGQITDDTLDLVGQHTEGNTFEITMEFSNASMEGESCSQIIIRDQAGNSKELEKQLNVLSKQDLLTGLYNHTYFIEQADKMISRAVDGKAKGSLLHILLDKYEDIKTNVGISGRDHVLTDIATLLKEKIGKLGLLARFEGPVFTLLLDNSDQAQAEKIADVVCKLIHDHISEVNTKSVTVTSSVGITSINETTSNLQDCLERAEKGAFAAEKAGGDQFSVFNPAIEELAEKQQHAAWGTKIKIALKENKFYLLYQPVVSLRGDTEAHYEVTLRLMDEGKDVSPGEFFPAAEAMGLAHFIDRWVIAHVFMLLSERMKQGTPTRFFVKLSSASLTDLEFLPWVTERMKSLRINADSIVFTVNEATALNYLKQAKVILQGLRSINCRVGLENFGIEQNVFQSLKHLDVNYLKIDSSVGANLKDSVENQDKLKEIAEEATEKNIMAIAAFVEDASSMALLWQSSVAFIQGNFLQEPDRELKYNFDE